MYFEVTNGLSVTDGLLVTEGGLSHQSNHFATPF